MLGALLLPEGVSGVQDRVRAMPATVPRARIGRGRPRGLPCHLLLESPSLWSCEPSAEPALGSPGNWSFLSFSLARLTC